MKFFGKTLGLLLASLALASCGGGGGDGGAFTAPQSGTITLVATTTSLPTNTGHLTPSDHGPNQAEVTITLRNADGSLLIGKDVSVSISPVNVAALSFLVNDDNDNFDNLWGSFTIKGTNGVATAWVNAELIAGNAVLTASAQDPTTQRTISKTLTFTVTSGVGNNPASVQLTPSPAGVYLPSSGGNNNSTIAAVVRDGGDQFVPDPVGADNLQYEIVGNAGDARLSTNSASGAATGTTVSTHTVNGQATASLQANDGTPQGPLQIKATADRADNNVSNGIQDPVTFTTSVIISDGKLYSLELTSPLFAPALPGITINTVSGNIDTSAVGTIPADPDATLSLTVSALGTDRQGNPVIPGTAIRFGAVDSPVGAPGTPNDNQFLISGVDGNPLEGGGTFTAPTGHFTTAGGGAGPGDALVVFGKAVQGNEDLESAVTVQHINSATSATVLPVFNKNNTTGTTVDSGPVLPYLFGRALHGNITAAATTNDIGVAHATLNYTVNTVGDAVAVWAQGDGVDRVSGAPRRVTDAGTIGYPGVAPASIIAFPNPIVGDTTTSVTVCVADALGIPLRGFQVGFQFNLTAGTGSIDGSAGAGIFDSLTGIDGCAVGTVVTSGLPVTAAGGNSGQIVFAAAGATSDPVDLVVQISALQASPNSVAINCSGSQPTTISVRALGPDGSPLPGVDVAAVCTASGGDGAALAVDPSSATTGSNGSAVFVVTASGFVGTGTPPATGTGQCTFSASGDSSRSVTVNFHGVVSGPSPVPVCN
jgi:hypothetical protein